MNIPRKKDKKNSFENFTDIAEKFPSKDFIYIKNAHQHNLKNINIFFPKEKFIVLTGPSGSGKSSLAMDTLYAEGRRKYAESLSAYIRQFLGKIEKPKVDFIHGLAPAIALEQRVISNNPRSSVGTVSEIYDYLKILFLRVGKIYDPTTDVEIKRNTLKDVVDYVLSLPPGTKFLVLSPAGSIIKKHPNNWAEYLIQQGITRILINQSEILSLNSDSPADIADTEPVNLVIDRMVLPDDAYPNDEFISRLEDSITTAFKEGEGECIIHHEKKFKAFNKNIVGIDFLKDEPDLSFFNYNHPNGACPVCNGFGNIIGIDPEKVIPDKSKSVFDDAIQCWKGEVFGWYKKQLLKNAWKFDFPVHTPIAELSKKHYDLLWKGNEYFTGINDFFKEIERELYKIQNRVFLSRFRGKTMCPSCEGSRLNRRTDCFKINGRHLRSLLIDEIKNIYVFLKTIKLTEEEEKIARIPLKETCSRLEYLMNVGLGYLTLHRSMSTLSGGESQRVNLASQLGSSLCGSIYILDEPSIGLHPRDTENLISILKKLRDQGNTVMVVEHDEQIIRASDWITDMGPGAGINGGEVLFNGPTQDFLKSNTKSETLKHFTEPTKENHKDIRRKSSAYIKLKPSNKNNLKIQEVQFPLHVICSICGPSGSGKSTLIMEELVPALEYYLTAGKNMTDNKLSGAINEIDFLEVIDQKPIGKSSRSNAITYLKVYDDIRTLYAQTEKAKRKGISPGYFSFNVEGGRCEVCNGEGTITIEMQFMADVEIPCDACDGRRFKDEALEFEFEGKNINDILNLSIEEAYNFFNAHGTKYPMAKKIGVGLNPLIEVGLGYLKMGQSSSTLSGGEAQRIKLAYYLSERTQTGKGLFVFDEPTTGLHFSDVKRLLDCMNALVAKGHSLIVIEHHPDVLNRSDYIIELGPEGGVKGGTIISVGTPDEIIKNPKSVTGKYLQR